MSQALYIASDMTLGEMQGKGGREGRREKGKRGRVGRKREGGRGKQTDLKHNT